MAVVLNHEFRSVDENVVNKNRCKAFQQFSELLFSCHLSPLAEAIYSHIVYTVDNLILIPACVSGWSLNKW